MDSAPPPPPPYSSPPPPPEIPARYPHLQEILDGKRKVPVILISLVLGFLSSLTLIYSCFTKALPYIKNLDTRVLSAIGETIPDNLEIKIQNGKAVSNVPDPYFLTVSYTTFENLFPTELARLLDLPDPAKEPQAKARILTINISGKIEDFEKFQSFAMLTSKNLVYYDEGKVIVKSLSDYPDMTLSKKTITEKIAEFRDNYHVLTVASWIIYLSPLIFTLTFTSLFLVEVIAGALLSLLISKILGLKYRFSYFWSLVGLLYTPAYLLLIIVRSVPFLSPYYFFFYTLADVILFSIIYLLLKNWPRPRFFVTLIAMPVLLAVDLFRSKLNLGLKIVAVILICLTFLTSWVDGFNKSVSAADGLFYLIGLTDKKSNIKVSGKSMLPTIKDGTTLTLHSPKKYGLERGDIVAFNNLETGDRSYLKRIIGLSGEKILLKNGTVYINGRALSEPYTNAPQMTYGNTYLYDCREYRIPEGELAVFGDNRLASTDSRVIGFVAKDAVSGVIKSSSRPDFVKDPGSAKPPPVIDPNIFVNTLNEHRKSAGIPVLHLSPVLSAVANGRSDFIAGHLESFKNDQELLTIALDRSGYDYTLAQEVTTMGGYTEDELVDHLLGLEPYNYDFLSGRYYDIGISITETKNEACQIPVIEIILAWPPKPSNSVAIAESYQKDIDMYSKLVATLKKLKTTGISSTETDILLTQMTKLIEDGNTLKKISLEDRWLTESEVKLDKAYASGAGVLQKDLGDYVRKYSETITTSGLDADLGNFRWGNRPFNIEANSASKLFSQGKYSDQLISAQKLLKLAGNDEEKAIAYYWEALAYYSLLQFDKAKASDLLAIKFDPNYAAAYSTLAATSFVEQDYRQALIYAQKCAALDPVYAWCHNNMGLAYYGLGQKDKAIIEMQKALSLDPQSYTFNDNLKRMKEGL